MAQAKVFPPQLDPFNPPTIIVDGWAQLFPVLFHGDDVPGGHATDIVEVRFLDTDSAFVMDNKIRDAMRVKATARGLNVGLTGVISFAPPRRL